MSFEGQEPVRSQILIHNKIIEKVISFKYSGNMICYGKEIDIDKKIE
jgi:hypothetical protein